uniref:Exocyst subunit Exo70 family protein n=1 Tax=Ananas comosus var. bracteatus TaxID=296719 RepID=A0A6V7P9V1_ANACO|nr:unnamed protein product [Ananas comosus var. bracteatus]
MMRDEDEDAAAVASLTVARRSLGAGLEKSRALSAALSRAGPRLGEIRQRLPSLEAAVRPIRARREALTAVGGHIDRAVGPAAAVLKVFDAVHGLEPSLLSDPRHDLPGYLAVLARLEEALRFLSENCGLALQWLDDILDFLADHSLADPRFLADLKSTLSSLSAADSLDGGLLSAALDKLESEFRRLLADNSAPLPAPPAPSAAAAAAIAPSPIPVPAVQKLLAILGRMAANGRLDRCVAAYVDVRGSNIRAGLGGLGLGYLDEASDADDAQALGPLVERWGRHLEFAVKHLFEPEYKLCAEVFEPNAGAACFADIAADAGILAFLRFGRAVAETKKDPIKLLRCLEIFNSLNKLRLDFNRLFGGRACAEIQNQTRDLIKRVVEGACEIFWELLVQVELQSYTPPPADGAVPKLVSFITDYLGRLLSDEYRPVLTQVLVIHRSWKREKFHDKLLSEAILKIVAALETNFDNWSKGYDDDDAVLSYLFMMNTHWHFFKHLKGTKLGELLGDPWLRDHEQYKEYYAAMFLRESWGSSRLC